jgi:hypothetical protein
MLLLIKYYFFCLKINKKSLFNPIRALGFLSEQNLFCADCDADSASIAGYGKMSAETRCQKKTVMAKKD